MKREIINDLIKWKNSARRKPLLLTGVRQSGKTYIVRGFGEAEFENCVYINFEADPKYSAIFEYDFNIRRILTELERLVKESVTPGKTLLFLDEIQECPRAVTSLKYFCEDMRELHVVCAGSLLGVAVKQENISFPVGKVNRMQLYPMDFREFVTACGEEELLETFRDWPCDRVIPDIYSERMKSLLRDFYIVGGMPEAVQTWTDTHAYEEVERVQNEILHDYSDDFSKHAPLSELSKIRWLWDSIPVQLAKENNKFVFSHVKEGKRSADLENALQWLKDAGLIYILEMVPTPELPLSAFADKTYFKVYMADTGLLRVRSHVSAAVFEQGAAGLAGYKGAFAENYVLCELIANGKTPYFWRSGNTAELDFLYEEEGRIIPVEVKAADNTQAKSYHQFCKRYGPQRGFRLSLKNIAENICEETKTYHLPLYLTWNMDRYK